MVLLLVGLVLCLPKAPAFFVKPRITTVSPTLIHLHLHHPLLSATFQAELFTPPTTPRVSWLGEDGKPVQTSTARRCHYRGYAEGSDDHKLPSVFSLCREVAGVLNVRGKTYTIQPVLSTGSQSSGKTHINHGWHEVKELDVAKIMRTHRRKRATVNLDDMQDSEFLREAVLQNSKNPLYLLPSVTRQTGGTTSEPTSNTATSFEDEDLLFNQVDTTLKDGYLIGDEWYPSTLQTRAEAYQLPPSEVEQDETEPEDSRSAARWLELAVVADQSAVKFHGEDNIVEYILTMLNIVSAILEDASLQARLRVAVTRIYLLNTTSPISPGLALQSLLAVNRWTAKLDDDHDAAVWLTRKRLGGPSGYAPVSGLCQKTRSCALNRDQGLSSAFVVAHELGHMLGLTHDGVRRVGNACEWAPRLGSVMAPVIASTYAQFMWSNCSRAEYTRKLRWWRCLHNEPDDEGVRLVSDSVEKRLSRSEQCRLEFGPKYLPCAKASTLYQCKRLWCSPRGNQLCYAKRAPPIDGTPCGVDRWCIGGSCQSIYQPEPSASAWGDWSPWSECSQSCDTGVRSRHRSCLGDDTDCPGLGHQQQVCLGQPPCQDDPREKFCSLLEPAGIWTAMEPEVTHACHHWCLNTENGQKLKGPVVPDGTRCSFFESQSTICMNNTCRKMKCGESAEELLTKCGGCTSSRETSCKPESRTVAFVPISRFSRIAILPAGARNIKFSKLEPSPHHLTIFDRKFGNYLAQGKQGHSRSEDFVKDGLGIIYKYENSSIEQLRISGPLRRPLDLQIYALELGRRIVLNVEYYVSTEEEHFAELERE